MGLYYLSLFLVGIIILIPTYVLLSHFRSKRKSSLTVICLAYASYIFLLSALFFILFAADVGDNAAMAALISLLLAVVSTVLIVILKFVYKAKKRMKKQ